MMRRVVKLDVNPRYVSVVGDRHSLDMSMPFCGHEEKKGTYSLPWSPLAVEGYIRELERKNIKIVRTPAFDDWLSQEKLLREEINRANVVAKPEGTLLYQHQVSFAARMDAVPSQYDASSTGSGKSISALAAIDYFRARQVLIVCPKVVQHQWRNYLEKWSDLRPVVFGEGSREDRKKLLRSLRKDVGFAVIMAWGSLPRYVDLLKRLDWEAIVCDEFHMARNRGTQRFEALMKIPAPLRIALSGTPIEASAADVWTFLRWTDRRYTSYWRFAHHAANVTHDRWSDVWDVEGIRNEEIFGDIMSPYMRRLELDQLEDIPDIVWEFVPLELDLKHRQIYNRVAYTSARQEHPLALLNRLRRLTVDPGLEGETYSGVLPKLEYLEMLSKELDHLLVYSTLINILRKGQERTGGLWLTGEVTDREAVVKRFEEGGGTLCMTSQMGIGLDFPYCDHVYMLDAPWSYTQFTQAIGRIRRLGGGKSVIIFPYAMGTIDERVVEVLEEKREISQRAMEQLVIEHVEMLNPEL